MNAIFDKRLLELHRKRDEHRSRGEFERALFYACEAFEAHPVESNYWSVLRLAERCGKRSEIEERIEPLAREELPDVLIERSLEADDLEGAVELWRQCADHPQIGRCARKLAEQAHEQHPEVAVACYLDAIDEILRRTGRRHYREACAILAEVGKLLERLEQPEQWKLIIDDLSTTHDHRPAFLDEMAEAGFIERTGEIRDRLPSRSSSEPGPDWLPEQNVESYLEERFTPILEEPWKEVISDPSVRIYNCLNRSDHETLRDVVRAIDDETILDLKGFGPKSLLEVRAAICAALDGRNLRR